MKETGTKNNTKEIYRLPNAPVKAKGKLARYSFAASLALLASGCVISSDAPPTEDQGSEGSVQPEGSPEGQFSEVEPIAESLTTTTNIGSDLRISIVSLERLENDILKLNVRITN